MWSQWPGGHWCPQTGKHVRGQKELEDPQVRGKKQPAHASELPEILWARPPHSCHRTDRVFPKENGKKNILVTSYFQWLWFQKKRQGEGKAHCKQSSQYQLLREGQGHMKVELTSWLLGILKHKGHMQDLGLNLGKKHGLRQTSSIWEKLGQGGISGPSSFKMGKSVSTRPLPIQIKGKGPVPCHATIKQALRIGVVLAGTRVMKTLRVILAKLSDFNNQTKG